MLGLALLGASPAAAASAPRVVCQDPSDGFCAALRAELAGLGAPPGTVIDVMRRGDASVLAELRMPGFAPARLTLDASAVPIASVQAADWARATIRYQRPLAPAAGKRAAPADAALPAEKPAPTADAATPAPPADKPAPAARGALETPVPAETAGHTEKPPAAEKPTPTEKSAPPAKSPAPAPAKDPAPVPASKGAKRQTAHTRRPVWREAPDAWLWDASAAIGGMGDIALPTGGHVQLGGAMRPGQALLGGALALHAVVPLTSTVLVSGEAQTALTTAALGAAWRVPVLQHKRVQLAASVGVDLGLYLTVPLTLAADDARLGLRATPHAGLRAQARLARPLSVFVAGRAGVLLPGGVALYPDAPAPGPRPVYTGTIGLTWHIGRE